jgi:uncharacterized protein YbjQ (UPF0145 family)
MKMTTKAIGLTALFVSLSLSVSVVEARNDAAYFSIQDALQTDNKASTRLSGGTVDFYFGDQPHPAVEATVSSNVVSYKKGSIGARTEEEACHRTFLAALVHLQAHARKVGGDAVINVEGFYANVSYKSTDKYECRVGNARTAVRLKGNVVRLKK